MTTTFTSLPIVDLAPLASPSVNDAFGPLAAQLHNVLETTGFAYLVNAPLTFSHDEVFGLAKDFFSLPEEHKMSVAKKTFQQQNENTYRGFFPVQSGSDSLKEGFEVGPSQAIPASSRPSDSSFVLTEGSAFPSPSVFPSHEKTRQLYDELQSLSKTLLTLLAVSLGKPKTTFTDLLHDSISTLRLLHYPAILPSAPNQVLNCTPHADSGLLTLLHQDSTGGLEVLNSAGEWIAAPYLPKSLVVNIGDLMAQMSGGKFVATYHRVRSSGLERYSVPFFCEPGVNARVGEQGNEVRYEDFVIGKMGQWVEFQDAMQDEERSSMRSLTSA